MNREENDMTGKMYKLKPKFHDYNDDDYIAVETLENTVCLMNARTNSVGWVTKHVLGLEYDEKTKAVKA
jgi:hypothetical protein